jgi:hypothetical protein
MYGACTSIPQGFVSLNAWNIESAIPEINANNLYITSVASHADCLYQYIGRYKYAVVMDTDELVVPYQSSTISDMLQELESQPFLTNIEEWGIVRMKGSFTMVNAFFPLNKEDDKDFPACQKPECQDYPILARKTKMIIGLTPVPGR